MTSLMMPKNGKAMMYTSGCPKNQKRCCQSITPPASGSNRCAPKTRSAAIANSAAASTGNTIKTMSEVTSTVQVNSGSRHIVMPGARSVMIVVMKLTAPRMVPNPPSVSPSAHRSPASPGLYAALDSGI